MILIVSSLLLTVYVYLLLMKYIPQGKTKSPNVEIVLRHLCPQVTPSWYAFGNAVGMNEEQLRQWIIGSERVREIQLGRIWQQFLGKYSSILWQTT